MIKYCTEISVHRVEASVEIFLTLFKSGLLQEEVLKKFDERAYKYRQVKGLLQKYYIHNESSDEFGGVYVFDSKENL